MLDNFIWFIVFFIPICSMMFISTAVLRLINLILILCSVVIWLLVNDLGFFGLVLGSVYIGAICILFIFAIITIYDKVTRIYGEIYSKLLFGLILFIILLLICVAFINYKELISVYVLIEEELQQVVGVAAQEVSTENLNKSLQLGENLFSFFTFYVLIGGLILLIGIIGTISLVFNNKPKYYNNNEFAWRYIERRGNVLTFKKEENKEEKKK